MAEPTREQFDAAVKAIIAGAKPGDAPLSREAFNQQITNEIARANPPERPSTSGFLRNLGDSAINLVTAPVRMVGSALTTDPGKTITNIGAGLRKRAGEYKRDPLGLAYRDPAGVGADLFAGGSILKALPGIYEAGMSGLRKAGGVESGESAYTGPKSSVLTGADQFRPNIAYRPTEGGARAGGAPSFPEFAAPPKPGLAGARLAGKAPTVDDAIHEALQGAMKKEQPSTVTAAPGPGATITPHGNPSTPAPANIVDETGRDLGTSKSGAEPRPAGPWDSNSTAASAVAPVGPTKSPTTTLYRGGNVPGEFWTTDPNYARNFGPVYKTEFPTDKLSDHVYTYGDFIKNPFNEGVNPDALEPDLSTYGEDHPFPDDHESGIKGSTPSVETQYRIPLDHPAQDAATPHGGIEDTVNHQGLSQQLFGTDWHSGAEPGSPEAASASSLHKELGTMDSDWKRRMMDDKGSINPDLLTGVVLDELLRKLNVPGAIRKVGGAVAGPLVEGGLDLAAGSNDSTGGR